MLFEDTVLPVKIDTTCYGELKKIGNSLFYLMATGTGNPIQYAPIEAINTDISSLGRGTSLRIKAELLGNVKLNAIEYAWN